MKNLLEVNIRRATTRDIPGIITMASEAIVYSISPFRNINIEEAKNYRKEDLKDLNEWLNPHSIGFIFVAETEKGELCGHLILAYGCFDLTGKKVGWLLDITVSPEFRGTGVGKKLHEVAEKILKAKKISGISLGVTSSNKQAIEFYYKLGYKDEHLQLVKVLN